MCKIIRRTRKIMIRLLIPSRKRTSTSGIKTDAGRATSINTPAVAEGSAKVAQATTNVTMWNASIVRGRTPTERLSPANERMPQKTTKSENPIIANATTDSEPHNV